jgi:protein ImuB
MAYAALSVAEFPVAAFLRLQPSAVDWPLVVFDGEPPLERVCARNGAAEALGIAHGMSRVQAEAAGKLLAHKRSLAEEEAAFCALLEMAGRYSPRVEAVRGPGNAYGGARRLGALALLDQSGTRGLFGAPEQYARSLREAMAVVGFEASVAVCANAHAAMLLAGSQHGVLAVGEEEIALQLSSLPVSALEPNEEMAATLARWGIGTLGALAALPEAALVSRLGQEGRRLQRLAHGVEEHLLVPKEPPFSLLEHLDLDTPVELLDSLLFLLAPMLEQIVVRARERAYALESVALNLTLESKRVHTAEIRPAIPSQDRAMLLKLLQLELGARPPAAAIAGITLTAEPARRQTAQHGLFQQMFPEPAKLDLLLARLRSIAGEDGVGVPALRNSHREEDFQLCGLQLEVGEEASEAEGGDPGIALRRLRPPEPVQVQVQGNRPVSLVWEGRRLAILQAFGPWQASGNWWNAEAWAEDEWDVLAGGAGEPMQALRLTREPGQGHWRVAGVYD